jgi:hypothetical protein
MTATLTDEQFGQIECLLNQAIHEAVFAVQHAEDNDLSAAHDCIIQVESNCAAAVNILVEAKEPKPPVKVDPKIIWQPTQSSIINT